jgi:glycine betaine/choline ABC-type transport system substrate-binding protein
MVMAATKTPRRRRRVARIAIVVAATVTVAACGDDEAPEATVAPVLTINVGRTSEPASQLLAELYGIALERADFRVGRKDPVADRATLIAQMGEGRVQLMGDFSASLLGELDADSIAADAEGQAAALGTALPTGVVPGVAGTATATLSVACTAEILDESGATSISELATAVADGTAVRLAATPSVVRAPAFGYDALAEAYAESLGDATFDVVEADDPAASVAGDDADCALIPAISTAFVLGGLIAVDDDLGFAAADPVLPVLTTAANLPEVVEVITRVNTSLTTEVLRALLVKAAEDGANYESVAKQFLATQSSGG